MFITSKPRGYARDGSQRAEGRFLILLSHNQYKWAEDRAQSILGTNTRDWRDFPADLRRKLYAHVCYVKMSQCGQFMMGESRTLQTHKDYGTPGSAPHNLILSGAYGGDGLTCDYEDLTAESRAKLLEVPAELAEKFWNGGGWNSAGSEWEAMRDWALKNFPQRPKKRAAA